MDRARSSRRTELLGLSALSLVAALFIATPANAALYWQEASGSQVSRANLDGSEHQEAFLTTHGTKGGRISCGDLAIDASFLYWGSTHHADIGRLDLGNGERDDDFIPGAADACAIAVSRSYLFWGNYEQLQIGRAKIDGSVIDPTLVAAHQPPCGMSVDEAHVFWNNNHDDTISRMSVLGLGLKPVFIEEAGGCGLAVKGEYIYWADLSHSIGRARLDGSEVEPRFITGLERPCGVVVFGGHIYWSEDESRPSGQIGRANLDGSEVDRSLIPDLNMPCSIVADNRAVPPPPPPPPPDPRLTWGKIKRSTGRPVVYLSIHAPEAGTLSMNISVAAGMRWRLVSGGTTVPRAGRWWLKLRPKGNTPRGRRLLRDLRRKGHFRISVSVALHNDAKYLRTPYKNIYLRQVHHRRHRSHRHAM